MIKLSKDFNFEGGLNSVLKKHWKNVRKTNPTFGTRPNRFVVNNKIGRTENVWVGGPRDSWGRQSGL